MKNLAKIKKISSSQNISCHESDSKQDSYLTLKKKGEAKMTEKKSVFIAYAAPIKNSSEAIDFINEIRSKYSDARHTVYAYLVSRENTTRYSDDGEPQGTAGLPILDVLRKNSLTDSVITVTRYFGGILLGAPGLVRAYTAAAVEAVHDAEIVRYSSFTVFSVCCNYSDFQKIRFELSKINAKSDKISYGDIIESIWALPDKIFSLASERITSLTAGRVTAKIVGKRYDV